MPKIQLSRQKFILTMMSFLPLTLISKTIKEKRINRSSNGFKVIAGEARFGKHYKMKGVTLNTLDIKISGKDTANDLAVFEQTGLTPNGGPPMHIHPYQDEWF
jgi:hypothetical protein